MSWFLVWKSVLIGHIWGSESSKTRWWNIGHSHSGKLNSWEINRRYSFIIDPPTFSWWQHKQQDGDDDGGALPNRFRHRIPSRFYCSFLFSLSHSFFCLFYCLLWNLFLNSAIQNIYSSFTFSLQACNVGLEYVD